LQYLTEQQWERDFPSRRGPAHKITDYMGGDKSKITPIMTNSESIFQFGNNAYGKPATALNILRETVLGRELFDFSFKTYANRWRFKHPTPADFFRTMEDASGVDLDWFWRSWFYTTDHVDIAISDVKAFRLNTKNPDKESLTRKAERDSKPKHIGSIRNQETIAQTQDEIDTDLRDFYTDYDPLDVSILDQEAYKDYYNSLSKEEQAFLEKEQNFYELTFELIGGIPMPIIFEFEFVDGTRAMHRIPAEIWRMGNTKATKVFQTEKAVAKVVLDPYLETADVDVSNNYYPPQQSMNRFELFKQRKSPKALFGGRENPMQRAKKAAAKEK
ncbi:MAG: M1 family peptidase, partial [Bacteroidota bacterium]